MPVAARRRPTLPTDQQGRVQVRDVPLGALRPVLRGRFADAVAVRERPVLGGAALGHPSAVVDPHFQGDIQSRPVAAFTGHPFWRFEGAAQFGQAMNFFKNVAMVGGMLALAAVGPGRYVLRS